MLHPHTGPWLVDRPAQPTAHAPECAAPGRCCVAPRAGIALLNGITGGVDTFVSQAHGSRSFRSIGLTLQRALLVSLLTCVPLMLLYACMHPVLLLLGQDPQLAAAAARYTLLYAPKVPLHAAILCCYRTLANQGGGGEALRARPPACGGCCCLWQVQAMPCHAMPCHAMPCHAMPCAPSLPAASFHPRLPHVPPCPSAAGAAMYVLAAGTIFCAVTAPLNWLLIFRLDWGLDGSAAAAVAAEAVYAAALAAACVLHNRRQPPGERWWAGWSRQALRDWGPFLRLSAAATAMIVADWWAYDILTLLAGLLPSPDVPLAATGIIYNLNTAIFMAPFGLSYAVCARVGHHLGGARPRAAKLAGGAFSGLFVHACSEMHAGHTCMHNCSAWLLASALVCARAQQFTDAPACLPACPPACSGSWHRHGHAGLWPGSAAAASQQGQRAGSLHLGSSSHPGLQRAHAASGRPAAQ